MINNRQGGRRRGRGGPRGQSPGGNHRQDNRQRGNAAQLLEKYKNMARDAQLAGDRVQSEYYLQFADHYFRVLGENRPRFDEQRRQRDDSGDEDESDDELMETGEDERVEVEDRQPRATGRDRAPRNGAPPVQPDEEDERIALEVLPPAIGRDADQGDDGPARPRRRSRRPRNDDDEAEVAPAA